MEAVQTEHWYLMVLLFSLLLFKVSSQQSESVSAARLGQDAVLECVCPWEGSLIMVSWTKLPETSQMAVFHPELGTEISPAYRGRVTFLKRTPLDGSIAISNASQQDLGLYRCYVNTFPLGSWSKDLELLLADEPLAVPTEVVPTQPIPTEAAPEATEADNELVVERNGDLTIRCRHEHNGSVHNVTVEKLGARRAGGGVDVDDGVLAVCQAVGGGAVWEELIQGRQGRLRVNCTDGLGVSVHLVDVVEEDGGLYRCLFHTEAGVHTTTVLLTVPSPVEFSLSEYMIYVYIGCGAAGFILLLGVFILIVLYRKRKRREEYRVKLHPAHRHRWRQWHME